MKEGELWVLTHAVYGLRESPKLWSDFRDCQPLGLKLVVGGEELQLQRGRLDPNWWKVVRTSDEAVVGGLLTYVDDFLLAGRKQGGHCSIGKGHPGHLEDNASHSRNARAAVTVPRG